jgi:small GTP-binding protein
MGNLLSSAISRWWSPPTKKHHKVLMFGLDAAGKTTLLHQMNDDKSAQARASFWAILQRGNSALAVNLTVQVWDVGGEVALNAMWRHRYEGTSAVVFVVDSTDSARFPQAQQELRAVLEDDDMPRDVPVLVLATKQDLPTARRPAKVSVMLELMLSARRWSVQGCCGTTGDGVAAALGWLTRELE